jgi:hypothetical protein
MENILEPDRPQMIIRILLRVRFTCWVTKATHTYTHTHTHSEYAIRFAFPLQQWLRERASMLRYRHTGCPVGTRAALFL